MDSVITKRPEWTQDELDNFMDVHGIVHIDDAIRQLNHNYEAQRNPVGFLMSFSILDEDGPESVE